MDYLRLLRPAQWTKNVFLFAGLIFGQRLTHWPDVIAALLGFACFCAVSSTVYVINDIRDRNEDRLHPTKCNRPIASGRIAVSAGLLLAFALLVLGLGGALLLDQGFFIVACAYILLQAAYTFGLKQQVLLDVILIGIGFVLRAVAGAVLVHVEISHWLVLCTFTLCLFMGFSKRRCELNALSEKPRTDVARHRKTLIAYTPELLNHMTTLTAGIAVVSFMLYATDKRTISIFGSVYLVYTLPLVVYAIFRFALLVEHGRVQGPTEVLTRDRPFQVAIILWGLAVMAIVYAGQGLHEWVEQILHPSGA